MTSISSPATNAYRRFLGLCIAFLLLIGGMLAWLWTGPGSRLIEKAPAFSIERKPDGTWPEVPHGKDRMALSVDFSKRESHEKFEKTVSAGSTQGARLATRSITVINARDDSLSDLVARGVIAGLQEDHHFERITYTPKGERHSDGERAPDLVLTIQVDPYQDDSIAGNGTVVSKVLVTMSDKVARGISFVVRPNDAPHQVHLRMTLESDINTEQKGFSTPNARIMATADRLSRGIVKKTRETLDEWRGKNGVFPELPAAFYPDYVPVDAEQFDIGMVFGPDEPHEHIASWHARFLHNESWWRGTVRGDKQESAKRIGERLAQAGFESSSESRHSLTYRNGDLEVELIPQREKVRPVLIIPGTEREKAQTTELHVRYSHHVSAEVRRAAIDGLIREDASPELLMMCSPAWDAEQRKRGQPLIDNLELTEPDLLLQRAELRRLGNDMDGAIDDLARAATFGNIRLHPSKAYQKAKNKARDWKVEFEDRLNDRDWLVGIGLREVAPGQDKIEVELTPDTPFRGFHVKDDMLTTMVVALQRDGTDKWSGAFVTSGSSRTGRFAIRKEQLHRPIWDDTVVVEFLDDPVDGKARVRIHARE